MTPDLHGPRRVLARSRRVCLPSRITDQLTWTKGDCVVRVTAAPGRKGELWIERVPRPRKPSPDRDPGRARPLDAQGQVTLPAPLMLQVGLSEQEPWVYFAADASRVGVRVIPAALVRVGVGAVAS
jgi:bifunctional DNA-binding transcriptional regulator/antitoxin component of YhaV-PrlF toxin-antitoxin module